jgi:hypothetical protein
MAHQYVPRPGRHPPVWFIGTGQRPGGLQKGAGTTWGRISRSRRRDFSARAGHQYGSWVRAGGPGTSMVHVYASQARAAGVWFIGTLLARAGGGISVCSWVSLGPGSHGVLTGTPRRPGRGSTDRVCEAQKKGGEAFASPDPYSSGIPWRSIIVSCRLRCSLRMWTSFCNSKTSSSRALIRSLSNLTRLSSSTTISVSRFTQ